MSVDGVPPGLPMPNAAGYPAPAAAADGPYRSYGGAAAGGAGHVGPHPGSSNGGAAQFGQGHQYRPDGSQYGVYGGAEQAAAPYPNGGYASGPGYGDGDGDMEGGAEYGNGDYAEGQYGGEYGHGGWQHGSDAASPTMPYADAVRDAARAAADGGGASGAEDYDSAAAASAAGSAYGWPSDPEALLVLLQQQRQQYRAWVAQCAASALAAMEPPGAQDSGGGYGAGAAGRGITGAGAGAGKDGKKDGQAVPDDVPGMLAAMDSAAGLREYLLVLKAAAEAVSEASRSLAAFHGLALPESVAGPSDDPAEVAAGEAAEAEYVSAAYAVTTAVSAAAVQVTQLREQAGAGAAAAAGLLQEILPAGSAPGGLEAPLTQKLDRIGTDLCQRLRQEAEVLMGRIDWPPPLADATAEEGAVAAASDAAFAGLETHAILARRLVGVLTALTHYQMAVDQRPVFYRLLAGEQAVSEDGTGGAGQAADGGSPSKPLLWAAKVLAEPVAAKLRAHFHPAAPTGRLDRPAWLYGTVLEFVRRHGHSLASLDDMLGCLQLKPHYNMPAEFARALQDAVLHQLRDHRIPAILQLRNRDPGADGAEGSTDPPAADLAAARTEADAEAEGLWLGLMDASAAYDIAMLPLLGATGPRVEAEAARAAKMLSAAATTGCVLYRRRACDVLDPTAAGTADMHSRYVALAALVPPPPSAAEASAASAAVAAAATANGGAVSNPGGGAVPGKSYLFAWAAAEGATALRAVEAVLYDDTSLEPAEQAAARALGGGLDDPSAPASGAADASYSAASGGGYGAPWQRDTWPSALAAEVARVLDGVAARSRWLAANPRAQRDFLHAAAGPVLAAVRQWLGRLVDQAVARGEVLSEEGLPRVCAALCAAHFLDDHLHSLLVTELAPLVQALKLAAAAAAAAGGGTGEDPEVSGPGTPTSSVAAGAGSAIPAGKLGGGGFWSGLLAASGGGGNGVPSSPARQALRDGVTALGAVGTGYGGGGGGAGSVASAAAGGGAASAAAAAAPVLGEYVRAFSRLHRDGCLKVAREVALGFGRQSVLYRQAIESNRQFPFTPEGEEEGGGDGAAGGGGADGPGGSVEPAASITPAFAPALLFLQTTLERLSRCCDKPTFADVWRGAALSINRFMFNFIATESRFTRAGARQFAADVAGLAQLFTPYSARRAGAAGAAGGGAGSRAGSVAGQPMGAVASASMAAGGQHFRELQAAARLLCLGDEEAADVMRRASAAAVAAQAEAAAAAGGTPGKARRTPVKAPPAGSSFSHARGNPVRAGMASDPVLSAGGLACLAPLQIMNVIEHRI